MMKKRKSGPVAEKVEEPAGKVVVVAAAEQEEAKGCRKEVAASREEGWWRRAGVVVSEQVPWGAMWLPSWDVELMGESYISALYSDVWDEYDDIWGFRTTSK